MKPQRMREAARRLVASAAGLVCSWWVRRFGIALAWGLAGCTFASAGGGGDADTASTGAAATGAATVETSDEVDSGTPTGGGEGSSGGGTTGGPSATSDPGDSTGCDAVAWYPDLDGDGFGDPAGRQLECAQPGPGHVDVGGDCDDDDVDVHPEADELCNDIDDDCDGGIDEGSPANATCDGCEFVLSDDEASYFAHCPGPIDWAEARAFCEAFGPGVDLAILDNAVDQATLLALVPADAWIGLSDLARTDHWVWVDGTESVVGGAHVGYDGWAPLQPDGSGVEHCGELDPGAVGWQDVDCTQNQALLCQHPA